MRQGNLNRAVRQAAFSMVETLEQRRMLSASVTSTLSPNAFGGGNKLDIEGTSGKDYIHVYDDPDDNFFAVVNDKNHNGNNDPGEEKDFEDADVTVVFIDAKQGDDTVAYNIMDTYDGAQRSIEVDLSDGNDKFTFASPINNDNCTPGQCQVTPDGADIVGHSSINLEVDGQEKNDTIDIDLSNTSVYQSELLINVDAGAGNDKVFFEAPNGDDEELIGSQAGGTDQSGGASDYTQLQLQVDLGSGNNLYSQELNTDISYAQLTINVNGGSGKDTVQAEDDYAVVDDAGYFFTTNLEGGDDYYNGELGFNIVDEGSEANYNLQGGDGNDRMTLEGETNELSDTTSGIRPASISDINGEFGVGGIFQVNMYGGTGNDTMDMWADENNDGPIWSAKPASKPASSTGGDVFPMFIDTIEDGTVRVVISGDAGNDKVGLFLGATEGSEGDYDLSVLGAAGKDSVAAGFADDTAEPDSNVTFGPSGAILVDGGRDSDKYQVESYTDAFTPFSIRSVESLSNSLLPLVLI